MATLSTGPKSLPFTPNQIDNPEDAIATKGFHCLPSQPNLFDWTPIRMKKRLLILLLSSGCCCAYAQPEGDSIAPRKNVVKISPLSLLVGDGSLFYERVLSRRTSLVGGLGFGWESFFYSKTPSPGRFHYERLTVEYRQYLTRKHPAPMGLYVGLYSRFARLTLEGYLFDQQGNFVTDQSGQFVKPIQAVYVLIPGAMVGV